ncbi:hypothetical protein C8J56DRAFT_1019717 [Mycena floridula]|nr:hypothetical protein C8J56DRAFT_1019717 [Mycena floridula]
MDIWKGTAASLICGAISLGLEIGPGLADPRPLREKLKIRQSSTSGWWSDTLSIIPISDQVHWTGVKHTTSKQVSGICKVTWFYATEIRFWTSTFKKPEVLLLYLKVQTNLSHLRATHRDLQTQAVLTDLSKAPKPLKVNKRLLKVKAYRGGGEIMGTDRFIRGNTWRVRMADGPQTMGSGCRGWRPASKNQTHSLIKPGTSKMNLENIHLVLFCLV